MINMCVTCSSYPVFSCNYVSDTYVVCEIIWDGHTEASCWLFMWGIFAHPLIWTIICHNSLLWMYENDRWWELGCKNGCISGEIKRKTFNFLFFFMLYLPFIVKVETIHGHFPSLLIPCFSMLWHFKIFTILSHWFTQETIRADPESACLFVCSG